jgi:hypothetical protein
MMLITLFALIVLNLFAAHIYFNWQARKKLESIISNLPTDLDELLIKRREELKAVRKTNQKTSYQLAALNIKLCEILLEESEDLYNQLSPARFVQMREIYKFYQSEVLGIYQSGTAAKIINLCLIFLVLPIIWILAIFAIFFFVATQYENNLGKVLAARSSHDGAA